MVVEWMRALQLPPHHEDLAVRQPGASCERCAGATGIFTELQFDGGWVARCAGCSERWLVRQ
jgi:hypothetical protein